MQVNIRYLLTRNTNQLALLLLAGSYGTFPLTSRPDQERPPSSVLSENTHRERTDQLWIFVKYVLLTLINIYIYIGLLNVRMLPYC